MPTMPASIVVSDTERRLQEIRALLQLLQAMKTEPARQNAITHTWTVIEDLCLVPSRGSSVEAQLIRSLFALAVKLRATGNNTEWEDEIIMLFDVISFLGKVPPKRIALQMPTLTDLKGNTLMANYPLALNKIATFTLTEQNPTTGAFDPVDPTDVFTVTANADPANLNAVIGVNAAGGAALVVNWLHSVTPNLTNIAVEVSDSMGNKKFSEGFDMVPPAFVPDQLGIDIQNVVLADQPVPV